MARGHVLITGAGTGIGRAIALRLAAEGYALSLFGRRVALLQETAEGITAQGAPSPFVAACDIRDAAQVASTFAAAAVKQGAVTGLVANAGIGGANDAGPSDRFDDLVATNLMGTYYCLRAAQTHLLPGPGPRHLVVISSILARFGVAGYTGYCASKTGLLGLVRALAMELAEHNIQVNAVCPGWVNTQMARDGLQGMADGIGCTYEEAYALAMKDVPLGRMSEPTHVAGLVNWLLGPDALGVTGQAMDMNNGAYMI